MKNKKILTAPLRCPQPPSQHSTCLRVRPQWLCQAKTDCWRVSCPQNRVQEMKKLTRLTYDDFGAKKNSRQKAVRVLEKQDRMKECADIRMNGVRPEIVKHKRHESWEKLLGKLFGIFGCGGGGKSTAMRQIATRLKEQGKRVHILSFQNSVCTKNGKDGCTIHMWIRRMNAGEIQLPCTCLVEEAPYCNIFVLSRLCPFMLLLEIQWIWVGDFGQPQAHGHWRGQLCRNGLCVDGRLSSFLPRDIVVFDDDKRSRCPVLKDFRARLRQAREEDVPAFIEEGRRLFRAPPPFAVTIVISHFKRRKLCRAADKRWRRANPDDSNRILETDDLGPIAAYVGMSVKALQTGPLVKGLWYTIECLEPIELKEQEIMNARMALLQQMDPFGAWPSSAEALPATISKL